MDATAFPAYASVILDAALDKSLDYGIPAHLMQHILPGIRVEVPVRGKLQFGFVLAVKSEPDFSPIKAISKVLSEDVLISKELMELAYWMSRYYCAPFRDILKVILPPSVSKMMKDKEQLYVMRGKTRDELAQICAELRPKAPKQADILDVMIKAAKGVLLTELLEQSSGSRASVDALAKQGWLILERVKIDRSPLINEEYFPSKPKKLNEEQRGSLDKIFSSLEASRFETHLLHGITGSGKTEIYLQAIDRALELNKNAIMLVPEISLTAQTIEQFRGRFKEKIAVLHHRLGDGERHDEWHHIRAGRAKIVIGARSAIFSPVVNLGLIIVDEEHEPSYKQNDVSPCYHARDVAVMRAKLTSSTIILGSATPSLESYYNASKGKYVLSTLLNRANSASLPKVTIIDMKKEYEKANGFTYFSDTLLQGIKKRMENGEQTLLFLNRRGYHTMLTCPQCQYTIKCTHCEVSLTFHRDDNHLSCHLCNYHVTPPPKECPSCREAAPLKFRGVGTELIEKSLYAVLPDIRTIRMDADTTKHKGSHQKLLRAFGTGKADVLIGTQMIAKGLHFPQVTLVGILNSDTGLNMPDFRASENTFQLMTQVAGRSGRGSLEGEVIIQTLLPENSTIQLASKQDYTGFYAEEIAVRELFRYPPFTRMAKISFSGLEAAKVLHTAEAVRMQLIRHLPSHFEIAPVVPCGYAKVKDRFRFQFLIRAPHLQPLPKAVEAIINEKIVPAHVRMGFDVDPSSTFF